MSSSSAVMQSPVDFCPSARKDGGEAGGEDGIKQNKTKQKPLAKKSAANAEKIESEKKGSL